MTKGPDARHLGNVRLGCEGSGRPVAADEQGNPVLAVAEVEGLRVWAVEREGVSDLAGEAREVAGLMCRWRKQVKQCRGVSVLG
ncbi:MAG: hypothetical protein ACK56I_12445, partial [bacterium]